MSDESELKEITGGKSYRTRQEESFAYVGTTAKEWRACDITAMNQVTGEPTEFDIDSSYETVTPISDRLTPEQMAELQEKLQATEWAKGLCELCGHVIRYSRPIAHDKKKLVMYVGSECVDNFTHAGKEYKKKEAAFKDQLVKSKFKVWLPIAKNDIWAKGKEDADSNRLAYPYFKFLKDLEKAEIVVDDLSARKIHNIFKRANKLGISSPADYNPDAQ